MTKDSNASETRIARLDRVKENVRVNSFGTCEYVSGFQRTSSEILVQCLVHNDVFSIKYENIRHAGKQYYPCLKCREEHKLIRYKGHRQEVECAYCHKKFIKTKASLCNSQSGLYFCCREHKDLAQRIESGSDFMAIRPEHYGAGLKNYRESAFRIFEPKCACCGWDEDIRILEVHHIDSDRENNQTSNLVILCPICHRKITLGYYIYDAEQKCLIKK